MSNTKRKVAAPKKKAVKKADLGENPFVIETGVIFTGNRGSGLVAAQLFEKVKDALSQKIRSFLRTLQSASNLSKMRRVTT
jgi:hypothetical protein